MRKEIFFFFFFFFLFCDLMSHVSSFLSLFPSLFFCLFLRISYAWPFEPRLIGVDGAALRRYNGKPFWFDYLTIFFFLLWKPFAPFLYMLEILCSYYYYPAYYRIKWYWNWMISCINPTVRVVQKVLDSNYA